MEKAVLGKEKSRYQIRIQDVCCAVISIMLGSIASPFACMFVFIYCAMSYIRSTRESTIVVFFVLLMSLTRGVLDTYLYALGFTCFFIIVHMIRLLEYNLYEWISGIVTLILIPYSVQQFGFVKEVVILPMCTYLLMRQMCKEYSWIQHRYVLPESMVALIVFGMYFLLIQILPEYHEFLGWTLFALMAILCEPITLAALFLLMYLCVGIPWTMMAVPMLLCVFQKEKLLAAVVILCLGVYRVNDLGSVAYFLYCFTLLAIQKEKLSFFAQPQQAPCMNRFQDQGLLKRQMLNYASIFQSLASYYATMSSEESGLLTTMAEALRYNADVISKGNQGCHDQERIVNALEGYQYTVDDFVMEEPKPGCLQIVMDIANIKRGEIKTTLKPLMEALMHRNLELDEIHSRRFFQGFHICMSDALPYRIDALADSVKNSYTGNGDTFSIFRFRQSMICMISDGMGNGERAAQSSQLITSIFQRMMISGITQDAAIKCINKLIQSDTFATLDVICFNYALGIAYISKSAACPTYLLRNHKIYEINGNALPVGIISIMQPDCFSIELEDGDEFIMMSDGVEPQEFYEWVRMRKAEALRDDVNIFREILEKKRRQDDSTFILASISKK